MDRKAPLNKDGGFVLVTSVLILLVLTLLGIWGLNTGTFELQIAGNQQRYQEKFNVAEGGGHMEATLVGFSARDNYKILDPKDFHKELTTSNNATYDDPQSWPQADIVDPLGSVTTPDPEVPYSYFVTYLYPDVPPKGYSPEESASYKFRINGRRDIIIELGGMKLGVPL